MTAIVTTTGGVLVVENVVKVEVATNTVLFNAAEENIAQFLNGEVAKIELV